MTRLLKKGGIESVKSNFIPFMPRCKVKLNANYNVPNGSVSATIPWDTEEYDTDNMHDLVTNPDRITIKTPGVYLVSGAVNLNAHADSGIRELLIYKNGGLGGTPWHRMSPDAATLGIGQSGFSFAQVSECAAGDYFQLAIYQGSGGALAALANECKLDVSYIGPLTPNMVRDKPVVSYVTPTQFAALTPIDGDEVYLIMDATNGVTWHLRYNAGSSSAYKWEFIGGPSMLATVTAEESGSGAGPFDLATVGPQIVLPRAGDYEVEWGFRWGAGQAWMALFNGASYATSMGDGCYAYMSNYASVSAADALLAVAAGSTIKARYGVNAAGTASFGRRFMRIRPRRIS